MTTSQYDRLVWRIPGVEGQLVTMGKILCLDFFISRCQGLLTHGHMQPVCTQNNTYVCIHTCTHAHLIPSKWGSKTLCLGYMLRQPLNCPYDDLDIHLTSNFFPNIDKVICPATCNDLILICFWCSNLSNYLFFLKQQFGNICL